MRFGLWRGAALAIALTPILAGAPARADWFHTLPREVPAVDYRTGNVMMAPPIPYGEYTKDYLGTVHGALGMGTGMLWKVCGMCRGMGCGMCGHKGKVCGYCGGNEGRGCNLCNGAGAAGAGHGHGRGGLFGHHKNAAVIPAGYACNDPGCGGGHGGHGGHGHASVGTGMILPSAQAGPVLPSGQGSFMACGTCGGKGCGLCGGKGGLFHHGNKGARCGDPGCGLCGGGNGGAMLAGLCGGCGGKGCGKCGGSGKMCGLCGGKGCAKCKALLGSVHAALGSVLHHGGVKYFVGPGGPVPLTPGYVNYVVPVRSPRDYFAFPPFVDVLP